MLIIRHRVNTVRELAKVPLNCGIEIDLRSRGRTLILQHEAFRPGERFEDLLKNYRHSFLIVNTKEDGLEEAAQKLLRRYRISRYFFLDLSFPAMLKLAGKGERRIALRFSEYESVESCLAMKNKADWVWVDCFNKMPLDKRHYQLLKKHFKLCIVAPELQGHPEKQTALFRKRLAPFEIDAVCTKHPLLWKK